MIHGGKVPLDGLRAFRASAIRTVEEGFGGRRSAPREASLGYWAGVHDSRVRCRLTWPDWRCMVLFVNRANNKAAKGQIRRNGDTPSRVDLLAAHKRSIGRASRMSSQELFEVMVRAGIYTSDGHLTRRYGGKAHDQPSVR